MLWPRFWRRSIHSIQDLERKKNVGAIYFREQKYFLFILCYHLRSPFFPFHMSSQKNSAQMLMIVSFLVRMCVLPAIEIWSRTWEWSENISIYWFPPPPKGSLFTQKSEWAGRWIDSQSFCVKSFSSFSLLPSPKISWHFISGIFIPRLFVRSFVCLFTWAQNRIQGPCPT